MTSSHLKSLTEDLRRVLDEINEYKKLDKETKKELRKINNTQTQRERRRKIREQKIAAGILPKKRGRKPKVREEESSNSN